MTRDNIIRMAREVADPETEDPVSNGYATLTLDELERFAALVAAAERDRTARLVQDMQNELQALRDRLAKQKVRMWVLRDNPGISTMSEPSEKALWEPLGAIV